MDEKLTSLLRHLPALRAAGVTYLEVDGLKVLVDREPVISSEAPQKPESPYNDRALYNIPEGVPMPPSLSQRMGGQR